MRTYHKNLIDMVISRSRKCSIDKKMLPMKLHYLFYSLAAASALNYFPLIAKNIGVSATGLGITYLTVPFLAVFMNPIFGYVTDKFKKIKFIIILLIVLITPVYFSINFIPEIIKENHIISDVKLYCDDSNTSIFIKSPHFLMRSPNNESIECQVECLTCYNDDISCRNVYYLISERLLNRSETLEVKNMTFQNNNLESSFCFLELSDNCTASCFTEDHEYNSFHYYQFWLFVVLTSLSFIVTNAVIALSDAACFESLEGRVNQFGKQRYLLSLGWGISSIGTGYIVELANANNAGKTNFSISYYIMLPLIIFDIITLAFTDMRKEKSSNNILKDVRKIFVKGHPFFLVFASFLAGAFSGVKWNYGYWYLEDLGGSKLLMGIHNAMVCIWAEVPFMFISGWIIKRIGTDNSVCLAFITLTIWFFAASFISNPWLILLPDLVQGPSYGLFYAAMTSYGKLIAPPGTEATMQAILGATFCGLGIGAGCLLGGIGFDNYGNQLTFRFVGCFSIGSAIIYKCITTFIAGERSVIKDKKRENEEKVEQEKCYPCG
ncbi:major facilitator superfamily domain-containing protein 6-like [Centruroides sculpturatus]|uniref:major facilitator superfamily domain-containing protein 6-like n=1 Tax=Centruroides sculpturatus TaxID=218467 RepID=UPI000C6D16D4|nr:major facilitator superfamily domain-containing protein 6-like [Centruroides sculpturatus]